LADYVTGIQLSILKKKNWLVVLTILKNMSSSMGRVIPFFEMENKIHIPNHQPENLNI
jgi:hypothetical protein